MRVRRKSRRSAMSASLTLHGVLGRHSSTALLKGSATKGGDRGASAAGRRLSRAGLPAPRCRRALQQKGGAGGARAAGRRLSRAGLPAPRCRRALHRKGGGTGGRKRTVSARLVQACQQCNAEGHCPHRSEPLSTS
eukprot:181316-Chlamydomonas_euryale.AAC.1